MGLFNELKEFYHSSNKLGLLYGIFMAIQVLGFIPNVPQYLAYVVMILYSIFCFNQKNRLESVLLLLIAYIPIEILISNPHPYFKVWPRFVLFVLLLICVSPICQSTTNRMLRNQIFQIFLYTAVIVGVGSFFARFLGINYMKTPYGMVDIQKAGRFAGLTTHSMILGPLSGFAALYMVYNAYLSKKKIYWLLAVICIATCFFAASRTAVVACLAASCVMIYKLSDSGSTFSKTMIIIVALLAITFPLWEGVTDAVMAKQASNVGLGQYGSRTSLWTMRMIEFKTNPLFGVGFVSVAPEFITMWEGGTGQIEPGSSWLAIPSMLGSLGVIILFPFFISAYKTVWKMKDNRSCLCLGVLTFYLIHMISEGYIFSAGSYLCFGLWLTCGVCFDRKYLGTK